MADDPQQPDMTPQALQKLVGAFQQIRTVLTAYELDLFTAIGDARRTSNEVAESRATDPRATDRLMNALAAMGLLEKADGRFANTSFGARHLVRGRPEYMGGLMHTAHLWTRWSTLTEAVRRGTALDTAPERDDEWREAFMAAMHARGVPQATEVAAAIGLDGVCRVLDLAGGTGVFAMEFARARPMLSVLVFDRPEIVPITERYVAEAGLADRVTTIAGDLTTDEFESGFDLVFLSAIVHSLAPAENRRVVAKAAKALVPGGRVVVQDFLVDEDRSGPLQPTLFALNMLVATEAGDTYTESEIRGWMTEAGLTDVVRVDTSFGTSLLVGRRTDVG